MPGREYEMSDYFYGWYFRCQGEEESVAIIPAVHISGKDRSCSIQVITTEKSVYADFPIGLFRMNRAKGVLQIGNNLFSPKGISLRLEAFPVYDSKGETDLRQKNVGAEGIPVQGVFRFGEFSKPRYDIMGPFSWIPGMECRHAVYSMKHTVNGKLRIGEKKFSFVNGMGYMEGDSGTSFPKNYIWTQCFWQDVSFMAAAATIPLGKFRFTGTLGFLLIDGKEYRFATYLGASVKKMGNGQLVIRQGAYYLRIRMVHPEGCVLNAPSNGQMTRQIREEMGCRAELTLMKGKRVLLRRVTNQAAAEYEIDGR